MLAFAARPTAGRAAFEQRARPHLDALDLLANEDAINDYIKQHELWSQGVKEHYSPHQAHKCGYCEAKLTDYGDVEHFRPKSAIYTLKAPGEERVDLRNLVGRKFGAHPEQDASPSGYWWLAYDWDNYLVACGICNQAWKNALFPLAGGRPKAPDRLTHALEAPLLLDPFGGDDPIEHLAFDDLGAVQPHNQSARGRATIEVCGLDRPSLRDKRAQSTRNVHRWLRELTTEANPVLITYILTNLRDAGEAQHAHAGAVRAIVVQTTGMTWADFLQLAS